MPPFRNPSILVCYPLFFRIILYIKYITRILYTYPTNYNVTELLSYCYHVCGPRGEDREDKKPIPNRFFMREGTMG